MKLNRDIRITWAGHATFHLTTPEGVGILVDPWMRSNPACPASLKSRVRDRLAAMLLTHGHSDHMADLVELAQETGASVLCQYDLVSYLEAQNVSGEQLIGFNKGGTVTVAAVHVTMTNAQHSSSSYEHGTLVTLGSAAGYVLRFSNNFTVYVTGDTSVTMDMQIVGDLYRPDLTILPIGGHFTMDPRQAAYALKLIRSPYAIPCHFGTFPILSGTPEALVTACQEFGVTTQVIALKPGETLT